MCLLHAYMICITNFRGNEAIDLSSLDAVNSCSMLSKNRLIFKMDWLSCHLIALEIQKKERETAR